MSEMTLVRSKDFASLVSRCVAAVTHVAGVDNIDAARARMMLAFSQSAHAAGLAKCSGESVAYCIALSAITGLMPGGPRPDVWIIPRRRNVAPKGKPPEYITEANWQLSAVGAKRLAFMAGYDAEALLIHKADFLEIGRGSSGDSFVHRPDIDTPPTWDNLRAGVIRVTSPGGRATWEILRKVEIVKRREKAETDAVWREWPLEMAKKTLYLYGASREMWPLSEAARMAVQADHLAQIGAQGSEARKTWEMAKALPPIVTPEPPPEDPPGGEGWCDTCGTAGHELIPCSRCGEPLCPKCLPVHLGRGCAPPEPLPACVSCSGPADGFSSDGVPLCKDCAGGATLTVAP